jgi:hypothetical protein
MSRRAASERRLGRMSRVASSGPMADISITPLEPKRFEVKLKQGRTSTDHRVTVPQSMLDDPQLGAVEPEVIVRESMQFLLEREPPTSILSEFSLDVIPRYFDEYDAELRRRLTVGG